MPNAAIRSASIVESAIGILESHLQFLDEEKKANLLDDLLELNNRFEFVIAGAYSNTLEIEYLLNPFLPQW